MIAPAAVGCKRLTRIQPSPFTPARCEQAQRRETRASAQEESRDEVPQPPEEPTRHRPSNRAARHCALIHEMSTANPHWGAPRIHGELGILVSQSTVAKYMRQHPRPPSQTWRTFLTNHATQIMAVDLFVVPTITFRMLFVLVILAHEHRRIVHVAVDERSHRGLDGAAASQYLPRPRGARVSPARSRCGLRRCRDHHRRPEHPGRSNRAALALAERQLRSSHRINPT